MGAGRKGRGRTPKRAKPGRPPKGETLAERLAARRDALRQALVVLLESELPGSLRVLRERPALEAEIWGVEAQLAAEKGEHARVKEYTAHAVKWQAEARKSIELELAAKLLEIERRLGIGSNLAEEIAHLR